MGAVLLQNGTPIAYASRNLTEAQQRYAQIEKEALAILYGCQRFHHYIYGRKIEIESEHKPLENIFKKPLNNCPLRLQRIMLSLQQYDINVKYKRGTELYFADELSRTSHVENNFDLIEDDLNVHIQMIKNLPVSNNQQENIRIETKVDDELQKLKQVILEGWPKNKYKLDKDLIPYWKNKELINEIDDILYLDKKIIIPKKLRNLMIEKLHYNHLGINKTILKAKEILYWPFMTKDIQNKIKNCTICLKYQNINRSEPIMNRNLPTRPWETVAADLFYLDGVNYLLVVDYYSKYPELVSLKTDTTATTIINHMKNLFSRHGIPEKLITDNGPQFINQDFVKFTESWQIDHKTSSPRYPQSNGFIERNVQTIKKILKKAIVSNKDPHLTLLEWRNTPIDESLPTPAELLFGRKIRGIIPTNPKLLEPQQVNSKLYHAEMKRRQNEQTKYYNKNITNKEHQPLKIGDQVIVKIEEKKPGETGVIEDIDKEHPRCYKVRLYKNNKCYIRNIKFIKKYTPNYNHDLYDEIFYKKLKEMQLLKTPSLNKEREDDDTCIVEEQSKTVADSNQTINNNRPKRNVHKPSYLNDYVCI